MMVMLPLAVLMLYGTCARPPQQSRTEQVLDSLAELIRSRSGVTQFFIYASGSFDDHNDNKMIVANTEPWKRAIHEAFPQLATSDVERIVKGAALAHNGLDLEMGVPLWISGDGEAQWIDREDTDSETMRGLRVCLHSVSLPRAGGFGMITYSEEAGGSGWFVLLQCKEGVWECVDLYMDWVS